MSSNKKYKVSVRSLIEYSLRSGDLIFDFGSNNRTLEGLFAHQKIQKNMGDGYQAEVHVSKIINFPSFDMHISGRIDGLYEDEGLFIIDEIKSTYVPLDDIDEDFNQLHWAQAVCYGFIYAEQEELSALTLQLTYINLDHDSIKRLRKKYTFQQLKKEFYDYVDAYGRWIEKLERWNNIKLLSIKELDFPFDRYRNGQRELAVAVYKTIKEGNGQKLFARAPTGTGKTLATLFPAIKAIGEGHGEKIFYLTAKTIGREVADKTLMLLENHGLRLRRIILTAKDKVCFLEHRDCNSGECPYTKGYFDKLNDALDDILQQNDRIDRQTLLDYAEKHQMCPYEFSLDVSNYCDVIICDYNYAFDPRVALRRYFTEESSELILLVDEAHNLVDRGRDMYSSALYKKPMLEMKNLVKSEDDYLTKLFNNVNKSFIEFRKICEANDGVYKQKDYSDKFLKQLRKLHKYTEEFLNEHKKVAYKDQLMELFFEINNFIKIAEMYDDNYMTYYEKLGTDVMIKLFCLDPAEFLKKIHDGVKAIVVFSATLLPMQYFIDLLGGDAESYRMHLASPFDQNNLELLFNTSISTKYKHRERTYDQVAHCIYNAIRHDQGNYFAFFSSYAYMNKIIDYFMEEFKEINILAQKQGMNEEEKEEFLNQFKGGKEETMVAFAVMGSSFSEGIDLIGDRLQGVIIVGVGLPMICFERNIIKEHFDHRYHKGFEYAYVYPGMNKVLQAVGRVIRTEEDIGIGVLIDERYGQRMYQKLFPNEWSHGRYVYHETQLNNEITSFWHRQSTMPFEENTSIPYTKIKADTKKL
ncbi:ATP-dependent DNA helicase [Vallitalea okinawensis]|uniref:ATP-dependent DNA helicase n=1 Tax=Vallitalea okinawensis TaxID=2078660 RepID=UPI000CFAE6E8|nr:ATP-dependent DNA helicase [Vallitalea okinawensis]